jgi:hypothetical protein
VKPVTTELSSQLSTTFAAAGLAPDTVAVRLVGAAGGAFGVTGVEAADAGPVPAKFVAVTVKVYAWPLVRPVIACKSNVEPALLSTPPAGLDVTV